MSVDVTVLRVFTDAEGDFGNSLGVVDAAAVDPDQHQCIATELGYSETVFVTVPAVGATTADARIYTSLTEGWVQVGGRVVDDGVRQIS